MDTSGVQQNCLSMILGMSALARCAVTTCKRSTMSKLTTLGCICFGTGTNLAPPGKFGTGTQHRKPHNTAGQTQHARATKSTIMPATHNPSAKSQYYSFQIKIAHIKLLLRSPGIQQGMPTTNNVFSAQRASTCCTACGMLHCTGMAHQGHTSAICQCPLHGTDNPHQTIQKFTGAAAAAAAPAVATASLAAVPAT